MGFPRLSLPRSRLSHRRASCWSAHHSSSIRHCSRRSSRSRLSRSDWTCRDQVSKARPTSRDGINGNRARQVVDNSDMGSGCLSALCRFIRVTNATTQWHRWTKPADEVPRVGPTRLLSHCGETRQECVGLTNRTRPRICHGRRPQCSHDFPVSANVLCAAGPLSPRWRIGAPLLGSSQHCCDPVGHESRA